MSRKKKLRKKFWSSKQLSDFEWRELVTLMEGYGYTILEGDGSKVKFRNPDSPVKVINVHNPHPGPHIKQYSIKQIKEKLDKAGFPHE